VGGEGVSKALSKEVGFSQERVDMSLELRQPGTPKADTPRLLQAGSSQHGSQASMPRMHRHVWGTSMHLSGRNKGAACAPGLAQLQLLIGQDVLQQLAGHARDGARGAAAEAVRMRQFHITAAVAAPECCCIL
jgi:hypothetical protein